MAILLNCDKLEHEMIPAAFNGYKIVIMNTNKRRELAASKYNERRSECDAALTELRQYQNIASLAELTGEEFNELEPLLSVKLCVKEPGTRSMKTSGPSQRRKLSNRMI